MAKKDKVIDADFKELDENGNPIEKPEEEKKEGGFCKMLKTGGKKALKCVGKGALIVVSAAVATFVTLKATSAPKWIDIPLKGDDDPDELISNVSLKFKDEDSFKAAIDNGMEVKFDDK